MVPHQQLQQTLMVQLRQIYGILLVGAIAPRSLLSFRAEGVVRFCVGVVVQGFSG